MVNGNKMNMLAVIPARYASTRFPGKPLVEIQGKSMIRRVYEQVERSGVAGRMVVATDDVRIFDHVLAFGGQAMMTRNDHPSGTDRCAEVAASFPEAEIILNIQGDEPFIQPEQIRLLAETLLAAHPTGIATLAKKIASTEMLFNANVVKVVGSTQGRALYFSRHPIPYLRGHAQESWLERHDYFKHIGLYGFRRDTLMNITRLSPSPLERAESLEQLRWLENGYQIALGFTELETAGIDTPEDLEKVNNLIV